MHTPCHARPPTTHAPCDARPPPHMPPAMHTPSAMHAPCHACPLPCMPHYVCHPSVDRMLDTHLWKHYLSATSLRVVEMGNTGFNASVHMMWLQQWHYIPSYLFVTTNKSQLKSHLVNGPLFVSFIRTCWEVGIKNLPRSLRKSILWCLDGINFLLKQMVFRRGACQRYCTIGLTTGTQLSLFAFLPIIKNICRQCLCQMLFECLVF